MDKPKNLKTVTLTTSFQVDADLPEDDIMSVISDALVQIDEAVLRDEEDFSMEWEIWSDRGDTYVLVDGVEISRELGVEA